jgi:hypothetical protein
MSHRLGESDQVSGGSWSQENLSSHNPDAPAKDLPPVAFACASGLCLVLESSDFRATPVVRRSPDRQTKPDTRSPAPTLRNLAVLRGTAAKGDQRSGAITPSGDHATTERETPVLLGDATQPFGMRGFPSLSAWPALEGWCRARQRTRSRRGNRHSMAPGPSSLIGQRNQVRIQNLKKPDLPFRIIDVKIKAADCRSRVKRPAQAKDCRPRSLSRAAFPRFVSVIPEGVHESVHGQTAFFCKPLQPTPVVADAASDLVAVGHDAVLGVPTRQAALDETLPRSTGRHLASAPSLNDRTPCISRQEKTASLVNVGSRCLK